MSSTVNIINRINRNNLMIEFNPDGSIKLPEHVAKKKASDDYKMQKGQCIKYRKDIVSERAPKKCQIMLTLSEAIIDERFVLTIHKRFSNRVETPTKIEQLSDNEFKVEIGTDFRRCSDCQSFIGEIREFLYGNMIEESGTCTKGTMRKKSFCYEDYFD